jgi:hypothetical protein
MFHLPITRIIFISRIPIKTSTCLFHSSRRVLQNSTSQSNENTVISKIPSATVIKNEESNRTKYVLYLITIFSDL